MKSFRRTASMTSPHALACCAARLAPGGRCRDHPRADPVLQYTLRIEYQQRIQHLPYCRHDRLVQTPARGCAIRSHESHHSFATISTFSKLADVLIAPRSGIQEVDNDTARHPGDDQPAILGALTGMMPVYGKMRNFEGALWSNFV